jgi:molybdate transport system ATP-binding protein
VEVVVRELDAALRLHRGGFRLEADLTIPPDRTVALLGPNGAGKSTVVAALAGLLSLDEGHVVLAGTTLDDPAAGVFVAPEHRRVGVVFQDYLLFPHLSVLDNVAFGLRCRFDRPEASERARLWLARLGLEGIATRRPGELSGGQAQRVALARTLATEPQLLLLDEPLAALDVTTRLGLRRALGRHLAAFDGPRLLITHDPTEAFLLADEVVVIEGGAVTQSGSADDIRLRPRTRYAADLAGSNLVAGVARGGVVDTGSHLLHIADHGVVGPVLVTIRPAAITLHRHRPEGSPRNSWPTAVDLIEHLGERVRVRMGEPLGLTAEITEAAAAELSLRHGSHIWIAIKATEIGVEADYRTAGSDGDQDGPPWAR